MAVTHPTTRLDLFTVPWGKPEECHAIVDFPTAAAQVAAFDDLAAKGVSATKFNYIKKDQAFRIEGNFARFEAFNYCRYQNRDFVNRQGNKKWYYAFIDRVEYIAQDIAMIYITTDYWQTYQFNITYYKSLIARAHVKKARTPLADGSNRNRWEHLPTMKKKLIFFPVVMIGSPRGKCFPYQGHQAQVKQIGFMVDMVMNLL